MRRIALFALFLFAISAAVQSQTLKFDELVATSSREYYFFDDDKSFDDRLARFIQQLRSEGVRTNVYLIHYRARVSSSTYSRAEQRASRAKWEIRYRTKIKDENVYLIDGGLRDQDTVEFWIGRKGSAPPDPTPTYKIEEALSCPSLLLNPQGFQFNDEEPATFAVQLSPKMQSRFEWSASPGKIISGQGTERIDVDVHGLKTVNVRVTALDLPIECTREKVLRTDIGRRPILLDEYGRLPESDIRARLDYFLASIASNPESTGYVVIHAARSTPNSLAMIERLLRNHFAFRNFDPSRIVIVKGGYREELLTQIWLVPPGATPPTPRPTVDTQFVVKTKRPARRARKR